MDASAGDDDRKDATDVASYDELAPTRYSLLSRIKDWGDQESWRVFFDTYWRLIYSVAIRSGLSAAEAEDVVQETVLSVARDISKFSKDPRRGSFKGWLLNLVRWRIMDQFRQRGNHTLTAVPDLPNPREDLDTIWEKEWDANLLSTALSMVKRQVKAQHYQIFDLYVMKQWPARKIAAVLGVSLPGVYVAKHRVSLVVKRKLKLLGTKPTQL